MYGQVISDSELVVREQYLCSVQEYINWYWEQQSLQQAIIVPTCTILHPRLNVVIIRCVQDIPNNFCDRPQAITPIQVHTIFMIDDEYDYIYDLIERR